MTKSTLKKNLYAAIERIEDDSFLEAVYKIVSTNVEEEEGFILSTSHKEILDDRVIRYKSVEGKSYSWEEAKKEIRKG